MNGNELKLELGIRAKEIIANGLNLKVNKSGKALCPLHNEKTPSISWYETGLMWRCHACKGQIDIYDYYMNFENLTFTEAMQKVADYMGKSLDERPIKAHKEEYQLPKIQTRPLSENAITYMSLRKIIKETLEFWKVEERTWNNQDVYVFNYYDDKNKLVYVSYRGIGKNTIKGGCEPNTKSILWGMNHIDKTKPVVITEGQPDAMVVWQSGYKNVVSVPNGSNNFKWIDHCWEWLQEIQEFIVFADNDAPGLEMANKIKQKLRNVKIIHDTEYKDANEVLFYKGEKAIIKLIEKAIKETPAGIIDLSEVEYKTAIKGERETIETGFYEYDSYVEDWKMQELTVIFGRNGEGKTTFISQIIAHCIEQNTKTFLYSGEMSEQKIQDWLYRQLIGNQKKYLRTVITKYREKAEPKPEIIEHIKKWHKGKLFLYDRSEKEVTSSLDKFFETMELAAKRYGVKLFVIDNLMSILEENADSLFSDQANFVQRCKNFAIDNWVHVVLLAHPNKEKKELKDKEIGNLEKTDISGSNNIPNKADNIISVERIWGDNREFDALITSLKDRQTGQRKQIKMFFSRNTLRFYNNTTKENRTYSWEKTLTPEIRKEFIVTPIVAPWDEDEV